MLLTKNSACLRGLLLGLLLLSLTSSSIFAQGYSIKARSPALGVADRYGFGYYAYNLGSLSLSGHHVDIVMEFSTDPKNTDGILGGYLRLPLLESLAFQRSRRELIWVAPDQRLLRLYSVHEKDDFRSSMTRFERDNGDWFAEVEERRTSIISTSDENLYFVYKDGVLVRFKLGIDSEEYSIARSGGRLLSLRSRRRNDTLLEFKYDRHLLAEIKMHDQKFEFVFYSGNEIRKRGFKLRELSCDMLLKTVKKTVSFGSHAYTRSLRLDYSGLKDDASRTKSTISVELYENQTRSKGIIWEVENGKLFEDDESVYKIDNPSRFLTIKTSAKDEGKIDLWSSQTASIGRTFNDGRKESWSYRNGIEDRDYSGGRVKQRYLQTAGIHSGKTRSIEVFDADGDVISETINSYDSRGRLLRRIENGDIFEYIYDRMGGYLLKKNDLDYQLVSVEETSLGVTKVTQNFDTGDTIISKNLGKSMNKKVNGEVVSYSTMDEEGRLKERLIESSGLVEKYIYYKNVLLRKEIYEDGTLIDYINI